MYYFNMSLFALIPLSVRDHTEGVSKPCTVIVILW